MKRIIESLREPVAKRTRTSNPIIFKDRSPRYDYTSATEFENFCKNDKIIDWFCVLKNNTVVNEEDERHPLYFLFEKGIEYENNIIARLREKTGFSLEKHSTLKTSREYCKDFLNYAKNDTLRVIESMKKGEPMIYSAYLCDKSKKLHGIPDLLVRNDYISTLFTDYSLAEKQSVFGNYYYVPVEIKFSTMYLDKNAKFIQNINRIKFYKTQLFTYAKLLHSIQGVLPTCAFIIGKRSVSTNKTDKKIYDPIEKPGYIDYLEKDDHIETIFNEGLEWIQSVKKYGMNWSLIPDLYPNMKNNHPLYQTEKKQIVESLGEITEIWQCGVQHRENAFKKGIYSWKDPRLNSQILNVYEAYREKVDLIIKINRGELGDYYPSKLKKNTHQFMVKDNEMFVDFETVRNSFDLDDYQSDEEWIFLIGVWYNGVYTSFLMKELTAQEERRVIDEFYQFWETSGSPKCWYWYAETSIWDRCMKRNCTYYPINWVDLYEVFYSESFVVKGCKSFKLKHYAKSLAELGKIDIEIQPEGCVDGLQAMMIAWKYYNSNEQTDLSDVIKYNKIDCIYINKLLSFIRSL